MTHSFGSTFYHDLFIHLGECIYIANFLCHHVSARALPFSAHPCIACPAGHSGVELKAVVDWLRPTPALQCASVLQE